MAGSGLPPGGVEYEYLANSRMVETTRYLGVSSAVKGELIRDYDPDRDLLKSVENKWTNGSSLQLISKYAYGNDTLGRRTHVVRTGSAFGASGSNIGDHFDAWGYNDRNELTGSSRY